MKSLLIVSFIFSALSVSAGDFRSPEKIELKSGSYIHLLPLGRSDFGLLQHQDCDLKSTYYPVLSNYKYSNLKSHVWIDGEKEYRFRLSVIQLDEIPFFYNQIEFLDPTSCRNAIFNFKNIRSIQISLINPYDWGKVPEAPLLLMLRWNVEEGTVELYKFDTENKLEAMDHGRVTKWHQ